MKKDYDGEDFDDEVVILRLQSARERLLRAPFTALLRPFGRSRVPSIVTAEQGDPESNSKTQIAESTLTTSDEPKHPMTQGNATPHETDTSNSSHQRTRSTLGKRIKQLCNELMKPLPITILFSLPIALINPLKALFVPVGDTFHPSFHPIAPDGEPPLAFILDTTTFAGNASVPIGLICIGSALARLKFNGWASRPCGAIIALAVGKMIVMPIIGAAVVAGFVKCGLLSKEDKVLQFVCL